MSSLKGRNAVVTGSTSGIGLAIAMELAAQGANILIDGVDSPVALEATAENIRKATGAKVIWSVANMAKPEEIREMIAQAERELGSVDILVNNAGVQHVSPIEDFPEDKWNLILAVNLTSAFHTIPTNPHMLRLNMGLQGLQKPLL
jgi:3-hydroxybutyrate dehydrogenase